MTDPADVRATLAADLLRIGAVALRPEAPFTWASGWRSPIYTDNRLTLGHVAVRRRIRDAFAAVVARGPLAPDVVAGTATAGIPHAAFLAEALDLPMCYVRTAPKAHGRGHQIEGPLARGQRVVLVEDLVSTGGSSLAAVAALRDAGAEVAAVLAVFTYGFPHAAAAFAAAGVPVHALTDYDALVAGAAGRFSADVLASLRRWREDPAAWDADPAGADAERGARNAE